MKPLTGIRVLDLSRVLAGPLCTQTLGDLGAEIVKVEPYGKGDESRAWPPYHEGQATAFMCSNRHKKSLCVDLKKPEGLEIVRRLARRADVVVESSATGVAERLGVDSVSLRADNPRLIYCTISGFGRSGPMKDARGYDLMLQAFSGMMSVTGEAEGGFVRIPFSPIDQTTGYHAALGIMAALMRRGQTGEGALVEVSLFETAVSFVGYMLQAYWKTGELPQRSGIRHDGICPYGAFRCADKTILVGVANDKLWRSFCGLFGVGHHLDDPRFATNAARVAHRAETDAIVRDLIGKRPAAEVLEKFESVGIPCAPIHTLEEIASHPHTQARDVIGSFHHPVAGEFRGVKMPIVFDNAPRDLGAAPPLLGEHTDEVLASLGYDAREIAAFHAMGVAQTGARP